MTSKVMTWIAILLVIGVVSVYLHRQTTPPNKPGTSPAYERDTSLGTRPALTPTAPGTRPVVTRNIEFDNLEKRRHESDTAYQWRVLITRSFQNFKTAAHLTPEQERAILRILYDWQINLKVFDDITERHIDEYLDHTNRNAINELQTLNPSIVEMRLDVEDQIKDLLNDEQALAFRRSFGIHIAGNQIAWAQPLVAQDRPE